MTVPPHEDILFVDTTFGIWGRSKNAALFLIVGHSASRPLLEAIRTALREWDSSLTDAMVAKFENIKLEKANAEARVVQAAVGSAKSRVEAASDNHRRMQKRLKESRVELERVITVRLECACFSESARTTLFFNKKSQSPPAMDCNVTQK